MTRTPVETTGARWVSGSIFAASGMACVGSGVAASRVLVDAPLFTAQVARYAVAAMVLWAVVWRSPRQRTTPRGADWIWLLGLAGSGLVLFNVAMVRGVQHADAAVLGVAVACVPVALAVAGPLASDNRPGRRVLGAAGLVTIGAAVVAGGGTSDGYGFAWAALVLAGEAAFTLLAVHRPTRSDAAGRRGSSELVQDSRVQGCVIPLGRRR